MSASARPSRTLSEADSKALLAPFGLPIAPERVVGRAVGGAAAAGELGFPVVAKLCGDAIAHKTERGLVRLNLTDAAAVAARASYPLGAATTEGAADALAAGPS